METIKQKVNAQLAILDYLENITNENIANIIMYMDELEDMYSDEMGDTTDEMFIDLQNRITEIQKKYWSVLID